MLMKTSIGENKWDFMVGELPADSNASVEHLSASLQSCEPFCGNEIDSSKDLVEEGRLRPENVVCALYAVSIAKSSERKYGEKNNTVRCDNSSEKQCNEIVCSTSRRIGSLVGLELKPESKRVSRIRRKISSNKLLLDVSSLKVCRRRRSYLCQKARSSDWGSLQNIGHLFKQNPELDENSIVPNKFVEVRSGRRGGKKNKNQKSPSSQRSREKHHAANSCIRLKITVGKDLVHSRSMDKIPAISSAEGHPRVTRIKSSRYSNTKGIKNKFEEKILSNAGLKHCNGKLAKAISLSGSSEKDVVDLADKGITGKMFGEIEDVHDEVLSQKEADLLEVAVDNRCLDPGTSPDSEVINLISDVRICGKVSEGLDDVLATSQDSVSLGDVSCLSLPSPSCKKGNKKKVQQKVDYNLEGDLGPEVINSAGIIEKDGYIKRVGDGTFSLESSISTTLGNDSVNMSTNDVFPVELPIPSSQVTNLPVLPKTLEVESACVGNLCSTLSVPYELGSPDNVLPRVNKKGHKPTKSSRSSKSRSEVPQLMFSKRNSCKQKGNQLEHNDKEKGDGTNSTFKKNDAENGSDKLDLCTSKIDHSTLADVSNMGLVTSVVPDQYVQPQSAWVSCDDCGKWRRISVALVDSIGGADCHWICKDNIDKNWADCSIPQEKSNAEINAELDISDASCAEDSGDTHLKSNRLEIKHSTVSGKSSWKHIRSNLFLHRTRKNQIIDEIMVCHCKAPLGGRMGCRDGCLNRMLNIECVKGTCPCGELCSNNQFQKRKYAKLKCFRSGKKGYGLQLEEDIHVGQFLIEYVGEVLDMHTYEDRQREYALNGHRHFYFMTLNGSEVIDACAKGNLGRFINHSCEPNCRTEKWMVNGEVCIGIFALRDIKKGEEVTFDYNYVRVFGAAAKKCVCGSSLCRGYIGGDPSNAEVFVEGDSDEEYPEQIIFSDDCGDLENVISATSSIDVDKTGALEKYDNQLANAVDHFDVTKEMHAPDSSSLRRKETDTVAIARSVKVSSENEDSLQKASYASSKPKSLTEIGSSQSMPTLETSFQLDDVKGERMSETHQESSASEGNKLLNTTRMSETSSSTKTGSKALLDATDIIRKPKYAPDDKDFVSASHPIIKNSHSSSLVKKGKSRKSDVHVNKPAEILNKVHQVPHRSKKLMECSSNDPFEAVQVKLNELLDADGGISRRKDASKGYLKLLFLTAASGDSGNGEAIQSTRDLSMILDALLKTKSRTVLVDIINKNGLQMLHNIMKRYRKEFHKIPILRKLLKVLEYLAVREILTLEHITSGPPCAGVESFRDSILSFTVHTDKQVHQIARNFRDKWIPWSIRKMSYIETDADRIDFHRGASTCNGLSPSYSRSSEAKDCIKKSLPGATQDGACSLDSCSDSYNSGFGTNGTRIRKRKSRWDQSGEKNIDSGFSPHKEPRVVGIIGENNGFAGSVDHSSQMERKIASESVHNFNGDVPPGFSPLNGSILSSDTSSTHASPHQKSNFHLEYPCEAVMGHPQERFISRLPVSFGIPVAALQQFGTPQRETTESWTVAAGIPFHPFPPLPPYPHDRRGHTLTAIALPATSVVKVEGFCNPPTHHSDQNSLSTSNAYPSHIGSPGFINQQNFKRTTGTSNCLGQKYFRQQKSNNAKMPPWLWNRLGRGKQGDGKTL